MASRDLNDLTPDTKKLALKFLEECKKENIDVLIYCTLRGDLEQAALYASGRSIKGEIKTNAKPGQSAHNPDATMKASAFDCCPLRFGKPAWNSATTDDKRLWTRMGEAGERAGLSWSGRWTGALKEMAHFQNPNWRKPA